MYQPRLEKQAISKLLQNHAEKMSLRRYEVIDEDQGLNFGVVTEGGK